MPAKAIHIFPAASASCFNCPYPLPGTGDNSFDEPTSHLDFKNQALVLRTIKKLSERGMTIVMTSHFPNHVWKVGTKVAMLGYQGMVAQGPVEQVMTEENLTRAYGINIKIHEASSGTGAIHFCEPDFM